MASNSPLSARTRTISMPAAEYDKALGWLSGISRLIGDLEIEAAAAVDYGAPLDPSRMLDYLRLSRQTLKSATEVIGGGELETPQ